MPDLELYLTNCDRELIHIPGQIQSHGFIIVVDENLVIRFYSANASDFVNNLPASFLGQPLSYIEPFLNTSQPDFITRLIHFATASKNFGQVNPFQFNLDGLAFNLILSETGQFFLLEFEPASANDEWDVQKMISHSIAKMLADKKLASLLSNAAIEVKNIINYDRVMIYRFAEDGHGEVVAEAKNDSLEPWLGLHYPASDIPKQARELYKLNLTRLIANVDAVPSKIVTDANITGPLDLSFSQLRAVSPVHIQYLKNMGVASSFSISILYKNELWGLIACHNYTPQFINYKSREASKLIGQILSGALEFRQGEETQKENEAYKSSLDKISKYLQKSTGVEYALTKEHTNILSIVNATGALLIYENNRVKLGATPDDGQIDDLIQWLQQTNEGPIYHTHQLSAIYPQAASYKSIASGMLLVTLSKELKEYILWFKPEVLKFVTWAGNPEKPVETDSNGTGNLSPRHSFDAWSQTVAGTSDAWSTDEISAVMRLKEEIVYAINVKASAIRLLNEKLRQAYEELDTFSYTISHDLKNPITAIKGYAQMLEADNSIGGQHKKILQRITERADKMNFLINAVLDYAHLGRLQINFKKINTALLVQDIIKDLDLEYDENSLRITTGKMPDLYGDAVMISQVFSNLLSNAVKYSLHADPAIIHIAGTETENETIYIINDNGLGIAAEDLPNVFLLFNRMENAKNIEGSGVGLAIVKRIIEKHNGKIWAESELGEGTTFFVSFNKEMPLVEIA